jgi:pimeloyl-ACP methyl ester carboxylesterase
VSDGLRALTGGSGPPSLLLLHGLGATADVWTPLAPALADAWPGRWLAVDLPGHGGSAPLPRCSFGALASAVAAALPPDEPVVVLGHSLGGVVGLALASGWFGVRVSGVVGLGIKVSWTDEELAKARALAARPVAWFDTREQAAARHLLVAGLTGLVDPDDDAVTAGLREDAGRWRLALDPRLFGVGAPDLPGLLAAARAPVVLARGEHDAMVTAEQLAALVPDPVEVPDCEHNAHVERPELVAGLLAPFAR